MEFNLSNPRCKNAAAIGDGDWLYIAGGANIEMKPVECFRKINLSTGEKVNCMDLRLPSLAGHLVKYSP